MQRKELNSDPSYFDPGVSLLDIAWFPYKYLKKKSKQYLSWTEQKVSYPIKCKYLGGLHPKECHFNSIWVVHPFAIFQLPNQNPKACTMICIPLNIATKPVYVSLYIKSEAIQPGKHHMSPSPKDLLFRQDILSTSSDSTGPCCDIHFIHSMIPGHWNHSWKWLWAPRTPSLHKSDLAQEKSTKSEKLPGHSMLDHMGSYTLLQTFLKVQSFGLTKSKMC